METKILEDDAGEGAASRGLGEHFPLALVVLFSALYFLYFYAGHPSRPGAIWPQGWWGWYDQSQSLVAAQAIRSGLSVPRLYQWPFGYPLLGAPFVTITPFDPFIIPNLLAFASTLGLFYKICEKYVGAVVGVLASILLVTATPLTNHTVIPWNTTPALITVALWVYVALTRERLGYLFPALGAALLALTYAARGGGEIFLLIPLGAAVIWQFRREEHLALKALTGAGVFLAGVGINLYFTMKVFGSFVHPYYRVVLDQYGFVASRVPRALWGTLIYSGHAGEFWNPLLREGFWMIFAPLGFVYALIRGRRRAVHIGLWISMAAGFLMTAAYTVVDAEHLKYHAIHYFKLWFPVLGFYSAYGLTNFFSKFKKPGEPSNLPSSEHKISPKPAELGGSG